MPIECPIRIEEALGCTGCRHQTSDKCWWFFPARDISDILTESERITQLTAELADQRSFLLKELNTLKEIRTAGKDETNRYKYK